MLFVPRMSNLYQIWMTVLTKEDFAAKYEMEIHYVDELQEYLAANCSPATNTTVYVNKGVNTDSKLET